MFCKNILALFLWCHSYQIILNPLLYFLDSTIQIGSSLYYYNNDYHDYHTKMLFLHSPLKSGLYVSGLPITVEANQVALTPGHEFILKCKIPEYPDEKFSWFRIKHYSKKDMEQSILSNTPLPSREEELKQVNNKYIIQDNAIIIKSPTFDDVGDYYCRVKNPRDDLESSEKMITVRARPFIYDFDIESSTTKSAIVEEGSSLTIPCNVVDDFAPNSDIRVTWQMAKYDENDMNDVINGEDGIKTISYNATSHALIIDKVRGEHRRYYKCQVTNNITDNNKIILIRVKNKYTALWPTFGIVLELVILIGVICIVENRKVEPDKVSNYDRKAIQM